MTGFLLSGFLKPLSISQPAKKRKPTAIMPSTKIQFQRCWYSIVIPPFQSLGRKGVRQTTKNLLYLLHNPILAPGKEINGVRPSFAMRKEILCGEKNAHGKAWEGK
jgi:hypothetical protein